MELWDPRLRLQPVVPFRLYLHGSTRRSVPHPLGTGRAIRVIAQALQRPGIPRDVATRTPVSRCLRLGTRRGPPTAAHQRDHRRVARHALQGQHRILNSRCGALGSLPGSGCRDPPPVPLGFHRHHRHHHPSPLGKGHRPWSPGSVPPGRGPPIGLTGRTALPLRAIGTLDPETHRPASTFRPGGKPVAANRITNHPHSAP
jgi:hypothetical protein